MSHGTPGPATKQKKCFWQAESPDDVKQVYRAGRGVIRTGYRAARGPRIARQASSSDRTSV